MRVLLSLPSSLLSTRLWNSSTFLVSKLAFTEFIRQGNLIGDAGAEAIAQALAVNTSIHELNLGCTVIFYCQRSHSKQTPSPIPGPPLFGRVISENKNTSLFSLELISLLLVFCAVLRCSGNQISESLMSRIAHSVEEHLNHHVRPHSPDEAKPQNPLVAIVVNEEKVFILVYSFFTP